MTWSLAFPNFLVGLREGLEAGLVVTILIGAVRLLAPQRSVAAVWVGVGSAVAVCLSFGAVLTFTSAQMSPQAQEVFGGVLSLIAVGLVTSMVFWMRRAARGMSGELRSKVDVALLGGGFAVVITAFVAVAREGLEAALFLWTNAQAAGSSTAPLLGGLLGLLVAAGLCVALYRRVLKINLGMFFTVTGTALIVIVAGVFAYGLRDLQDAGVIPGIDAVAFDISDTVPSGTWWTELLRGITNLDVRMTWLQVIAYLGYLAIVLPLFLRHGRPAAAPAPAAPADAVAAETSPAAAVADEPAPVPAVSVAAAPVDASAPSLTEQGSGGASAETRPAGPGSRRGSAGVVDRGRRALIVAAAVVLPVAVGIGWVAIDHTGSAPAAADAVTVTDTGCAAGWTAPSQGSHTYSVTNSSGHAVDVEIVVSASQAVVGEIEVLGPGTTRDLPASFGAQSYQWKCLYSGLPTQSSPSYPAIPGSQIEPAVTAFTPATQADLDPVLAQYRTYVGDQLTALTAQVAALQADLVAGDRATAQQDWLTAHFTYHQLGAAYNAFGDAGAAVDGLDQGLPQGSSDPAFTGFHRIEYDLWHAAPMDQLVAEGDALVGAVDTLQGQLPSFTFDANDVTIRAHEILEDTLRFTLTGQDDYGSGSGFATARADLTGDRVLLGLLTPLLQDRSPDLITAATGQIYTLDARITAAGRTPVAQAPLAVRQRVNAATGQLLETLAPIPDLLEVKAP